jgi:hypothetical protein
MPRATLSIRVDPANPLHHLWHNNGVWWVHYTLNFDCRTRRIRRSLQTASSEEAIRRRDELFARLEEEGEWIPELTPQQRMPAVAPMEQQSFTLLP